MANYNGMLCGKSVGANATAASLPYNIDAIVLRPAGYQTYLMRAWYPSGATLVWWPSYGAPSSTHPSGWTVSDVAIEARW